WPASGPGVRVMPAAGSGPAYPSLPDDARHSTYFHAALNPSPPLTQRAVGGGIRATIPLQAALAARSGSAGTALLVAALAPAGRMFARRSGMRKVSIT
ncbi:prenyltransferase, partial [Streptomyces sp. NPDC006999]